MDIAGEIKANLAGKGARTAFNVLISPDTDVEHLVRSFLDQYLGEWTQVDAPDKASMFILVPLSDSRFAGEDVDWAELIFKRDGDEARIYEFDKFENKIIARTRLNLINRRHHG